MKLSEKKISHSIIATSLLGMLLGISCKKFVDLDPPVSSISADNVYQSNATAAAVLTGIYANMMSFDFFGGGITSTSILPELSADNLVLYDLNNLGYLAYYRNQLDQDYTNTKSFGFGDYWSNVYPKIYIVNAAIDGIEKSNMLSSPVKQRLLGEAYFLRAFYYFYLTNLFGDVALVTTTDYTVNSSTNRSTVSQVYQQIIKDLQKSIANLNDDYVDGTATNKTSERLRPNLSAAQALLSRVELYTGNYVQAESLATSVINKSGLYTLLPTDKVFAKNSLESIWSLQPVKTGYNTDNAAAYLLTTALGNGNKLFYLSSILVNSFESGDKRKKDWTGVYTIGGKSYPYSAKYKADANGTGTNVTEYNIVLRLSELYLIRAESRAAQNNISGAQEDINSIRNRAGLGPTQASTPQDLKMAILKERQLEFFTEWGHRWMDIKRSGKIDSIMQVAKLYKGGNWSNYQSLYPLPSAELLLNSKLIQNPGYIK